MQLLTSVCYTKYKVHVSSMVLLILDALEICICLFSKQSAACQSVQITSDDRTRRAGDIRDVTLLS